jgi:hypothetical protein
MHQETPAREVECSGRSAVRTRPARRKARRPALALRLPRMRALLLVARCPTSAMDQRCRDRVFIRHGRVYGGDAACTEHERSSHRIPIGQRSLYGRR